MTREEFNNGRFGRGDSAIYKGREYPIAQIEFEEALFGLLMQIEGGNPEDISWVRCESVEYIPLILRAV